MIKRYAIFVSFFLLLTTGLIAQTLDQGKKMIYYERFKSARTIFQDILKTDPNNEEAVYWLGQSLILPEEATAKDISDAQALYQSKMSIPNNYLIMVGVGHTELLQGKAADARNHFEAAISLTQGKNVAVLNAIGFANIQAEGKGGDIEYAIQKLTLATQVKKFNDPLVLTNLGDAYIILRKGSEANAAYESAIEKDPKCAKAFYEIGRMYQGWGEGYETKILDFFNKAIAADPAYPKVYEALYGYYIRSDKALASEYAEKWFNAMNHENPKECYIRASLKKSMDLHMEAVKIADDCIKSGDNNVYPGLYGIKAYAYKELKDTAKALENFRIYFNKQVPGKLTTNDYMEFARMAIVTMGLDQEAGVQVDKAVAIEKSGKSRQEYLELMATYYEKNKSYLNAAGWYRKIVNTLARPTNVNYYNLGYSFYRGAAYDSALSVFTTYTQNYPNEIFGQSWAAKSAAAIDTSATLGLAIPFFQKVVELGDLETDKTKIKDKYLLACQYLMNYFYYEKKDQTNAVLYADKFIAVDAANTQMQEIRNYMSKTDPTKAVNPNQKSKGAGKP